MLTIKYVPFAEWATRSFMGPEVLVVDDQNRLGSWTGSGYALVGGGVPGVPVVWGPFTASGVVKGVAGDPGTLLAVFCSASSSANITMRNSATVGGGAAIPTATAVAMSAGQMLVCGPVDCSNGIVLDLNSGSGTFYVLGL